MVTESITSSGVLRLAAPLAASPRLDQPYELVSHEEAPVIGVRYLLGLAAGEPIPPVSVRLGTTRGTNALITRRGARTALVITLGFGDLLEIGYQNRPRLFELAIHKPPPLAAAVIEIDEPGRRRRASVAWQSGSGNRGSAAVNRAEGARDRVSRDLLSAWLRASRP